MIGATGPRILKTRCSTCVFHPGNRMHLNEGRLKQIVEMNQASGSFLICHKTLPYGEHRRRIQPAVCRGYYDAYESAALDLFVTLFNGHVEFVPDPGAVTDLGRGRRGS